MTAVGINATGAIVRDRTGYVGLGAQGVARLAPVSLCSAEVSGGSGERHHQRQHGQGSGKHQG